jgi:N-methylhydantoinase A
MRAQAVEVVNVRLVVTGAKRKLSPERVKLVQSDLKLGVLEKRKVWFAGSGYVVTPVYDRDRLPAECRITGPAIIEQMDTTTVVPPRAKLTQDRYGYLHMDLESDRSRARAEPRARPRRVGARTAKRSTRWAA